MSLRGWHRFRCGCCITTINLGLISPACVDRSSGYRYYSVDQLPRLHRILALKDLGLSLEQVAYLLDGTLSAEELRGMLLLKQAELRQRVAEEQARLDRVQQRLRFIEQEGSLPEIDVVVKSVPALHVLSLRRAVKLHQPPHYVFYEAGAALRAHGLRAAVEAIMCRYHSLLHDAALRAGEGAAQPDRSRLRVRSRCRARGHPVGKRRTRCACATSPPSR